MARKDNTALAWAVGLGTVVVAGIGIYFYEKSQPAAPTTSTTTAATNVGNQMANIGGQMMTYLQVAQLAASIDQASLSTWQASGVPAASWAQMTPQVQGIMTALGYHQV